MRRVSALHGTLPGMLLAALLLTLCGTASAAGERRPSRAYDQWNQADANRDGRLSRGEAAAMPRLAPHFDAIDRNADGSITADEVRAWRASRKTARRRATPGDPMAEVFARADANGDGTLDATEAGSALPRIANNFKRIDADGDGRITRTELDHWIARRLPPAVR